MTSDMYRWIRQLQVAKFDKDALQEVASLLTDTDCPQTHHESKGTLSEVYKVFYIGSFAII